MFGEQVVKLARLVAVHGEEAFERACQAGAVLRRHCRCRRIGRILERGLFELPLPEHTVTTNRSGEGDFGRSLAEYEALLQQPEVVR